MLQMLWFGLASALLAIYVVMDGFDFGAGMLHLFVARTDDERRQVLGAIGPFWDGNEVWLLAAGGTLLLAFPKALGAGLSGFYLAIMMVLWVLIIRGIAIEFRSHLDDALWRQFWDGAFALVSMLAPVLFGAALGNLLRGVPMQADGWFSLPLFASFSPTGTLGVLDWFTVLVGVLASAALAHHGALFLTWRTGGLVRSRSRAAAKALFVAMAVLWVVTTAATMQLVPEIGAALWVRPLAWLATALMLAGLLGSGLFRQRDRDLPAFIASGAFLFGLLAATAVCLYPTLIRATGNQALSLTALNASSSAHALQTGLWWCPVGLVIAIGYVALLFRIHRGRVGAADYTGY